MADVTVSIRPNGPYLVSGAISIVDENGAPISIEGRDKVALCRCGGSVNKPFCDGTHSKIGFSGATKAVAEAQAKGQ
jgi:CDGSH-type Zn-finger protein